MIILKIAACIAVLFIFIVRLPHFFVTTVEERDEQNNITNKMLAVAAVVLFIIVWLWDHFHKY